MTAWCAQDQGTWLWTSLCFERSMHQTLDCDRFGASRSLRTEFLFFPLLTHSTTSKFGCQDPNIHFLVEAFLVISQTADYALRAVVILGLNPGIPWTTRQIAAKTRVPSGYLSKVLQALGRAGLVEAQRGLYGGFVLSRSLDDLTILDVINAVDPVKRIERCPLGLAAHGTRLCALHQRLDEGLAQIEALFGGTTIGQLIAGQDQGKPLCEPVGQGTLPTRT